MCVIKRYMVIMYRSGAIVPFSLSHFVSTKFLEGCVYTPGTRRAISNIKRREPDVQLAKLDVAKPFIYSQDGATTQTPYCN